MSFTGDGDRVRQLFDAEIKAMLQCYEHFEKLVPANGRAGAAHSGEDGRYVEALLRQYLQKYLPRDLEVLTGFILRPAVITARDGYERDGKKDSTSSQLDMIIYDTAHYPLFHRFENNVIASPEGVVAVLSVKKHLRRGNVATECANLAKVADLCRCKDQDDKPSRGPFLGIVAMDTIFTQQKDKKTIDMSTEDVIPEILNEIQTAYESAMPYFDRIVGYVGALKRWGITKRRPPNDDEKQVAAMSHVVHETVSKRLDWGFQYILSGILSVYYDKTRGQSRRRPGFTAFESPPDQANQFFIPYKGIYLPSDSWQKLR